MVHVYVLRGLINRKRYVGITADTPSRLRAHASGVTKGGQQLGKFELVYSEVHPDYVTARKREIFLKSGQGRKWLDVNLPAPASTPGLTPLAIRQP
jgi:putative endonuclease